ncbi:DUF6221 family protein [Nocardioides aquiterrae]|uniref:Uncharacterized protein n=1 Tax=Nocardioides aquiterrae TaxID=203799 RepID=A0ABN1UD22_9ACTN
MTLTDFLLARIAEDVAGAEAADAVPAPWGFWDDGRVLAECEAKRRIVGLHGRVDPCDAHDGATLETVECDTLRALAAVYADHPDYREEWRQ